MLAFLEIILATAGLTFIVTQSRLFQFIQKWYFFQCPLCFGFWAGLICYLTHQYQLDIINYGFIGSFISYILYLLVKPLIDKYD